MTKNNSVNKKNFSGEATLITFEGPDGSGKTSQIYYQEARLKNSGFKVIAFREPGGDPIAERIRKVVLSKRNKGIVHESELFLYLASRAQFVRRILIPSLKDNDIVLLDRFGDSSEVYQGFVRGLGINKVREINRYAAKGITPDMTILLDVDTKEGLRRKKKGGALDRLDEESLEFHEKVRDGYLTLARGDTTGRWVVIDANLPKIEVSKLVNEEVDRLLMCRFEKEGQVNLGKER